MNQHVESTWNTVSSLKMLAMTRTTPFKLPKCFCGGLASALSLWGLFEETQFNPGGAQSLRRTILGLRVLILPELCLFFFYDNYFCKECFCKTKIISLVKYTILCYLAYCLETYIYTYICIYIKQLSKSFHNPDYLRVPVKSQNYHIIQQSHY